MDKGSNTIWYLVIALFGLVLLVVGSLITLNALTSPDYEPPVIKEKASVYTRYDEIAGRKKR